MQAMFALPKLVTSALLLVNIASAAGCAHGAKQKSGAQAVAALPAPQTGGAELSDVDMRLVAEAIAYDASRAPWVAAWLERMRAEPIVFVGPVPSHVAGAGGALEGASFARALEQALRNTGALEVLPQAPPPAANGAHWVLAVTIASHDEALEGQEARVYSVAAQMHPAAGAQVAWEKRYPLRKRLRAAAGHDRS